MSAAHRCFADNQQIHLTENFLPEDTEEYLERLKTEIPWTDDVYNYDPTQPIDVIEELMLLCGETFECDVESVRCHKFHKSSKTQDKIQEAYDVLIYSFGGTRDLTLKHTIHDKEGVPHEYSLESGDILYIPPQNDARTFSIAGTPVKSTRRIEDTIVVIMHTTQPYWRDKPYEPPTITNPSAFSSRNGSMPLNLSYGSYSFDPSEGMFTSVVPNGVISSYSDGNSTYTTIDPDSDYGKHIWNQVNRTLQASGIHWNWDSD